MSIAERTNPAHHARNFFDCVRTKTKPVCNQDVTCRSHIACFAAQLSWQLGRKLSFDPVKEEFVNDEEANRMRRRAPQEPWTSTSDSALSPRETLGKHDLAAVARFHPAFFALVPDRACARGGAILRRPISKRGREKIAHQCDPVGVPAREN